MNPRPSAGTFIFVLSAAIITALAVGLLGAIAAVFLYDQGRSKGNDLAVALIGLHSFATFTFVVLFTSLWSRRAAVSWHIPIGALAACFGALLLNTIVASSAYDEYFSVFFYAAWAADGISGIAALLVCRRILSRSALSIKTID
jgi:hypothetical protein